LTVISKFYEVCDLFNDNLYSVAQAIIKAHKVKNKRLLYADLENLRISKLEKHLDIILAEPSKFTKRYDLIVLEIRW